MMPALLILFYLLASALIVFLCNRFKSLNSISEIAVPLAIPLVLFSFDLIPYE